MCYKPGICQLFDEKRNGEFLNFMLTQCNSMLGNLSSIICSVKKSSEKSLESMGVLAKICAITGASFPLNCSIQSNRKIYINRCFKSISFVEYCI